MKHGGLSPCFTRTLTACAPSTYSFSGNAATPPALLLGWRGCGEIAGWICGSSSISHLFSTLSCINYSNRSRVNLSPTPVLPSGSPPAHGSRCVRCVTTEARISKSWASRVFMTWAIGAPPRTRSSIRGPGSEAPPSCLGLFLNQRTPGAGVRLQPW